MQRILLHKNPFEDDNQQAEDILTENIITVGENEAIDRIILNERNESISEIDTCMSEIAEIWEMISNMVGEHGDNLAEVTETVKEIMENTEHGVKNLEGAADYMKDRIRKIRNVIILVAGGILGSPGLLLGPVVGIGTIATGVSAGGLVVYGLRRISEKLRR